MAVQPNPPPTSTRFLPSYVLRYFESAKFLKERVLNDTGDEFSDFPCAFLYRHAFELMLKAILVTTDLDGSALNEHVVQLIKEHKHGFSKYPAQINGLAKLLKVDIDASEWAVVERALNELQHIDDSSMEFRYPIDKRNGNFLMLATGKAFDLAAFAEALEPAFEILSGLQRELYSAVCGLGAERDGILEMIRELEREYST